ncbi:MAG: response regulator [Nitratireductor sp.]|nr:response regulator [Nitratireductor sp.]
MTPFDKTRQNIALVVDDNPDTLGMVATALETSGMTVLVARDGITAIDLVRRVDPDVILMDAVMPDPDGFETCRRLKFGDQPTPAPIIFMTGLGDPEHILKGLSAGGADYITKPVNIDELIARMAIHVGNAKMIQSARAALDDSGHSILAFDREGGLSWGSPSAIEHFRSSHRFTIKTSAEWQKLYEWMCKCAAHPLSENTPFELGDIRAKFIGISAGDEMLIKLNAKAGSSNEKVLANAFGLTLREAEVLYWLSMGKTNKDIGVILDLSARTVNKHLEQVFAKMGVDNRTSAAVMADRLLHSN